MISREKGMVRALLVGLALLGGEQDIVLWEPNFVSPSRVTYVFQARERGGRDIHFAFQRDESGRPTSLRIVGCSGGARGVSGIAISSADVAVLAITPRADSSTVCQTGAFELGYIYTDANDRTYQFKYATEGFSNWRQFNLSLDLK